MSVRDNLLIAVCLSRDLVADRFVALLLQWNCGGTGGETRHHRLMICETLGDAQACIFAGTFCFSMSGGPSHPRVQGTGHIVALLSQGPVLSHFQGYKPI